MMETIKRHLFLVALGGGVAVVALTVCLVTYFVYVAPNTKLRKSYESTQDLATKMKQSPIYTAELIAELAKQDDLRKAQYADILNAIRKEGAARKPLVAGVFPTTTDSGKRLGPGGGAARGAPIVDRGTPRPAVRVGLRRAQELRLLRLRVARPVGKRDHDEAHHGT